MSRMMNFGTERVTDAAIARWGAHPVSFKQIQSEEKVLANESGRAKSILVGQEQEEISAKLCKDFFSSP